MLQEKEKKETKNANSAFRIWIGSLSAMSTFLESLNHFARPFRESIGGG